jgi:cell fate (sporulation/competence/biofilm development) regulator YlbF (YheA/YmcA/DUF963 family)
MEEGSYLQNGREVFEKVAELKPIIEKKASDLIKFNRDQLIRTDSYLVEPSLVKQAIAQLDGLYVYASAEKKKDSFRKVSGLFRESPNLKQSSDAIKKLKEDVQKLHVDYSNVQAKLRAFMPNGFASDKVQSALNETQQAEQHLNEGVEDLKNHFGEHGELKQQESNKNMGIAAGFGIPSLIGLGYLQEKTKKD